MEAHERCIASTSVSLNAYQERNTTTVVGTQESFLEPPGVLLEGTYAQNEMKRGAITTLPGLREAFIVSKKRMHSYRVTSRLLSTRSIRLKRCSTTAKDDTVESYAAISLSPFAIRMKKSGRSLDTPRGDRDHPRGEKSAVPRSHRI